MKTRTRQVSLRRRMEPAKNSKVLENRRVKPSIPLHPVSESLILRKSLSLAGFVV